MVRLGRFERVGRLRSPRLGLWFSWTVGGVRCAGCRAHVRLAARLSIQSKLPGRKFQSHPGVPPARLIEVLHNMLSRVRQPRVSTLVQAMLGDKP